MFDCGNAQQQVCAALLINRTVYSLMHRFSPKKLWYILLLPIEIDFLVLKSFGYEIIGN